MKDSEYPDNIRDFDDDPRSPFYVDPDGFLAEEIEESLLTLGTYVDTDRGIDVDRNDIIEYAYDAPYSRVPSEEMIKFSEMFEKKYGEDAEFKDISDSDFTELVRLYVDSEPF